jgi:hypothetical protein
VFDLERQIRECVKYCGVLEFSCVSVYIYIYILDCGGELEGATELEKFMLGHGC